MCSKRRYSVAASPPHTKAEQRSPDRTSPQSQRHVQTQPCICRPSGKQRFMIFCFARPFRWTIEVTSGPVLTTKSKVMSMPSTAWSDGQHFSTPGPRPTAECQEPSERLGGNLTAMTGYIDTTTRMAAQHVSSQDPRHHCEGALSRMALLFH